MSLGNKMDGQRWKLGTQQPTAAWKACQRNSRFEWAKFRNNIQENQRKFTPRLTRSS